MYVFQRIDEIIIKEPKIIDHLIRLVLSPIIYKLRTLNIVRLNQNKVWINLQIITNLYFRLLNLSIHILIRK